jgi:hypothetical protein
VALVFQELGVRLILSILGSQDLLLADISWARGLEILVTALITPVFFSLIRTLERHFNRLGRSRRQAPATW